MLNPAHLKRAMGVAQKLGASQVDLMAFPRSLVGAVLLISSKDTDGMRGSIQLAGMVPAEGGQNLQKQAISAAA